MIGKTLNRYIAMRVAKGIALAFLVVTGIIMLVDFVESSRNLDSDSQISALNLLYLTLLKSPKLIEQTIPFIVLFGVMGALYAMNRRSELIVMRAAGLPAWKFLRPALWVTGLLGVLWAVALNPLATQLTDKHDGLQQQWGNSAPLDNTNQVWLRDGNETQQTVIFAKTLKITEKTLSSVTFYILSIKPDGTTEFERRFDAKSATLLKQGYWQLNNTTENAPSEITQKHTTISLPTGITFDDLTKQASQIANPSFWRIPATIAANKSAGFSTRQLRMQFNKLLALPVTLIAMTFIAASVSMQLAREGGSLRLLITGSAVGFGVYFADSVISAFGEVGILPVLLASWTTPLLILFIGTSYLARIEDG